MVYVRFSGNDELTDEEKQMLFDADAILLDPPFHSSDLALKIFDNCIIGVYRNEGGHDVAVYSEERLTIAHMWHFYGDGTEIDVSDIDQEIVMSDEAKRDYILGRMGYNEEQLAEELEMDPDFIDFALSEEPPYWAAREFVSHNYFPLLPGKDNAPLIVKVGAEFDPSLEENKDRETITTHSGRRYVVS